MKLSVTELVVRLMELLEQTSEGRIVVPRDCAGPDSVRNLGVDSLGLLNYLIAIEDEFGIEWQDDLPKGTLDSFEAIAGYVGKELGLVA
jgi:acyl carrier protein